MGDKSAAVSVLMPAYNHGKFIRQAIESFLAQEQADAHLYIGNDASTDNTLAIAQEYASRYPHKITLFSHSRNLGLMGNYKFLIENSASRYIAILESDDYWTDTFKLYKQVRYLDGHPQCGLVYSSGIFVDEYGHPLGIKKEREEDLCCTVQGSSGKGESLLGRVLYKNPVLAVTACFRRDAFERCCSMDDFLEEKFVTFDYPVWLGLASCSDFHSMADITSAYRVSSSSISNNADYGKREAFLYGIDAIVEYSAKKFGYSEAGSVVVLRNERVVKHMMLALAFNKFERYSYFCREIDPSAGLKWAVLRYFPWVFRFKKRKLIGTGALDTLAVQGK